LTITTYGIPAYSPQQALNEVDYVLSLVPQVLSQLVVTPLTLE
jgi:hypothetical protein